MNVKDAVYTWLVKRHIDSCGPGLRARNPGNIFRGKNSEIHLGCGVHLEKAVRLALADGARIYIGDNSYIGEGSMIYSAREVHIGSGCAISMHVVIMDSSSHPFGMEGEELTTKIMPVHIGDHVWIGSRAVILKGVKIGDGAIIANNAVVTREVPPKTMVAGNPARIIKEGVAWA